MDKKNRIMIVDDEKFWRDLLKEVLENDGHEVISVDKGDRAIKLIENQNFDVIILDIRIDSESEFKGIEVLDHVKKKSSITPVIMLTAYGTVQTVKDSFKKGAYDYFEKGNVSNDEIRQKVKDAIRDSLMDEIIDIITLKKQITRFELFEKIVSMGKHPTDQFDKILNELKENKIITEDCDVIKIQYSQNN